MKLTSVSSTWAKIIGRPLFGQMVSKIQGLKLLKNSNTNLFSVWNIPSAKTGLPF